MKIVHLIYSEAVSGAEKYIKQLLPGLHQYGIHCHLIVVTPQRTSAVFKDFCDDLEANGVAALLIVANRLSIFNTAKKINSYLKKNDIRIVHSHLVNSDLIATVLKTFFYPHLYLISSKHGYKEPVMLQYQPGKKINKKDLYYYFTKLTLKKINQNLAVSHAIADLFINMGFTKEKYPVIHHGVNIVEPFNKEQYTNTCRLANPQLIIVGRIETMKGHYYLLEALQELTKHFPEIKLLVIGEGSEKSNLINKTKHMGLQKHVQFMGFIPHPYSYINHSDIVVLPSLFEPFGLVYIEAFALQKAVVAFDTPAGNEIMENGITALMAPKGDSKQLAQKIIYLLNHPEERKKLEASAYKKYTSSFTREIMIENTANWYHSLQIN
ncbi:MAG: glycosyltransferase family 4 protein [Ferruginibacter sp.]